MDSYYTAKEQRVDEQQVTRVSARLVYILHWAVACRAMRDGQVPGKYATAVGDHQRAQVWEEAKVSPTLP